MYARARSMGMGWVLVRFGVGAGALSWHPSERYKFMNILIFLLFFFKNRTTFCSLSMLLMP